MATQSEVNQKLLDAQLTALSNIAVTPKEVAYLSKVIIDGQKTADATGTLVTDDITAPYGYEWNMLTDTYKRLGANHIPIQEGFRRVVTVGNPQFGGTIYKYLNEDDSTLYEDGSSATADINGSTGKQVFVQMPRAYVLEYTVGTVAKTWMSLAPFSVDTGTEVIEATCDEAFRKTGWTTNGSNEWEHAYVSAFEGVLYDNSSASYIDGIATAPTLDLVNDKLGSVAGFKPTSTITIINGRTLCENGGSKQFDWHRYSFMRLCFNVEYMTHDSQTALPGYTENTSGPSFDNDALKTGLTLSLGNNSGSISGSANHLAGGGDGGFSGVVANSYRGIENFYGHLWTWLDAINFTNAQPFICGIDETFASDSFVAPYTRATTTSGELITQPTSNGYQSELFSGGFFVKAIGATSATKVTDYYYYASGNRVLSFGGVLNDGSTAGVGCLYAKYASSSVYWTFCSRL